MSLKAWTDQRLLKIIDCDHFHVIFTLPSELNDLWRHNRQLLGKILFDSAHATLAAFSKDPRYLGAMPGYILTLHTWGRNLSLHPHIHCLITGGGVEKASGQWISSRENFLFPVKAMMVFFRGRFLRQLRDNLSELVSREDVALLITKLYEKNWNVFCGPKYTSGRGIMLYLARYVKGGPIKDERIVKVENDNVYFRYKDYRDNKRKVMKLSIMNFISRLVEHIPPTGFKVIRYYGLYAPRKKLQGIDLLLIPEAKLQELFGLKSSVEICPDCGLKLQGPYFVFPYKSKIRPPPVKAA